MNHTVFQENRGHAAGSDGLLAAWCIPLLLMAALFVVSLVCSPDTPSTSVTPKPESWLLNGP